jgi:SAM-dependent methyltransferase
VSGFSAEWLAIREPADVAARSAGATAFVASALSAVKPLRIVDLGSGTGSNLRYLSTRLSGPQQWRLVDNNARLLERARALTPLEFETSVSDLATLDPSTFDERDLVTASALLDLVSERWLVDFVSYSRKAGAAVLVALNYDGRIVCSPQRPDDEWIRGLVNSHQRTDKGFGPALGPDAAVRVEQLLQDAGYRVRREKSDWVLGSAQSELQRQLIEGWAAAALEITPLESARIRSWQSARVHDVDSGRSNIVVGHDDVAGVLS